MSILKTPFGKNGQGQPVTKYTLKNKLGASVSIIDFGGTITNIMVPDKAGKLGDVALGFDSIDTYMIKNGSLGALIGRFGNRIAAGRFTLNGKEYQLNLNDGVNHLHGGPVGFQIKMWNAEACEGEGVDYLKLTYVSPDGEENYPGTLKVTVTYSFDDDCNLGLHYEAETDKDTVLNLTNHTYFNLAGHNSGTVEDHMITIDADVVTKVGDGLIPTGEMLPVAGSPLDLRKEARVGDGLAKTAECHTMVLGGGYDCNYVLRKGFAFGTCAKVRDPKSGRTMEVITDQPGVQLYTGNGLHIKGKDGADYTAFDGLCLETQRFPDSPNHPNFPTTTLKAGEKFDSTTIYAFRAEK